MKIRIMVISPHGHDLLKPGYCEENPVGGSETAAARMTLALKAMGLDAELVTEPGPVPKLGCDIFISLRNWDVYEQGFRPGKLNYLWCQDDVDQSFLKPLEDPEMARRVYEVFDGAILISHYQIRRWQQHLHLPSDKIFKSENGIPPGVFNIDRNTLAQRPPHAYYASTPYRGLETLLDYWPLVRQAVPEAQLHIFSSMKTYRADQKEDSPFEKLFEQAKQMPGVVYQGSVSQARLRSVATTCRVLAYPCTFPETGCIAAMEAMASGCAVAGTDLGVLPETAWRNPLVPMTGDWPVQWAFETARLLVDDSYYLDIALQNLDMARLMGWDRIAARWCRRFRSDFAARGIRVSDRLDIA